MEHTDYSGLLPLEPPEGSVEYCQSKGKLVGDLMIYKVDYVADPITGIKEKKVKVKCTACGETYYLDYVSSYACSMAYTSTNFGFYNYAYKENITSGNNTICPECGAQAEAKHISNFYSNTYRMPSCHLMTVQKIENTPALVSWYMEYVIDKQGNKSVKTYPYEAFVYEKRKCLKYKGYDYAYWRLHFHNYWKPVKQSLDTYGPSDFLLPFQDEIFVGTHFENSKIEVLAKTEKPFLISYLKLYQKHKNVENLVMQGFSKSVNYLLSQTGGGQSNRKWSSNVDGFDWSKSRPHEMLGLDIEAYRVAKADGWNWSDIEFYRHHKSVRGWEFLTPALMKTVRAYSSYSIQELIRRKMPVVKVLRYLDKQQERYPDNKGRIDIGNYLDYLDTCEDLGIDITKASILYPKDLNDRHDAVTKQQKFKESEELNKKFADRQAFLENFTFEADGLIIRAAKSQLELIQEGEALDHCVARYADRHARGDTTIFFIRKAEEPDASFYTLEFDFKTKTVRQNRGMKNCARTDDVSAFEAKWLDFLKKKIKELEKNGKSVNAA